MNLKLQKRHRLIWVLLAILLPIGFVSAYLVIPSPTTQPYKATVSEAVIGEDNLASVHYNSTTSSLQVVLKKALTTPSTTLFLSNDETITNATLIGSLSSKKAYAFSLPKALSNTHLLFYDGIKQEVYHHIKFHK